MLPYANQPERNSRSRAQTPIVSLKPMSQETYLRRVTYSLSFRSYGVWVYWITCRGHFAVCIVNKKAFSCVSILQLSMGHFRRPHCQKVPGNRPSRNLYYLIDSQFAMESGEAGLCWGRKNLIQAEREYILLEDKSWCKMVGQRHLVLMVQYLHKHSKEYINHHGSSSWCQDMCPLYIRSSRLILHLKMITSDINLCYVARH